MTFASLGLIDPLLRATDELGYKMPTPVQAQVIPAVLAGRDVMAAAQTGTGKTAGFALPMLQRLAEDTRPVASNSVKALVLVPTRELADQVFESFRSYGRHLPLRYLVAYGGVSINPQMMKLRKGVDVLVATPGRLMDLYGQNAVKFNQVQMLVLDEADRMLDLGFSRELNAVFGAVPRRRQTLLFSATFSDAIRAMAETLLHDPLSVDISPRNTTTRSVKQSVITVDKKRKAELFCHLLTQKRWGQLLVFVKTRKGVDQLVEVLTERGLSVDAIHGDKNQPARLRALARFKAGEVQLLVATDVAARGLDIDDLPLVVNLDLPIVAEDYVHRIGRTGRAGTTGEAISLVCADEVQQLAAIEVLTQQMLPRHEEPGFVPEHRVPMTDARGELVKKPKKPKKPKVPGGAGQSAPKPSAKPVSQPKVGNAKPGSAKPKAPKSPWSR